MAGRPFPLISIIRNRMNPSLKALHLFDFYLPSTLSWVAQLLDHLTEVEVEVAAPWIVRNQFYNPRFGYHPFPPQRWLFPNLHSEFQHPGWQRLFIASQRQLPSYAGWLYTQLKNDPPELLHAHFGPMGCLYLPLARRLKRPLVVTFYGFDYTKLPQLRPAFYQRYRRLFAEAAQVIAASAVGCERLIALGCPPEKLAVVVPSPRLEHFPFQTRHKVGGQLRLLQVATFTAKKGHLTTLEAFRLALPNCPNLQISLAGEQVDAALVQQINNYIEEHRLADRIHWLDFVDHRRLGEFFGQFDVFIHPSCHAPDGDHEDTPVVILEAEATGLPVLSTHHFNIPAAVLHERTGLLAPERDAATLAGYIERFYAMENPEYQTFSQAAR
ncbi:MAG: glycosyltransferase, partial [Saprospiraceae bacterium]